MTTIDFITDLLYRIDDEMRAFPKHSQTCLWSSEVVTPGILHALKGVGNRAFYRWLTRDYRPPFPHLPERTRLFQSFVTHPRWTPRFLAQPRFALDPIPPPPVINTSAADAQHLCDQLRTYGVGLPPPDWYKRPITKNNLELGVHHNELSNLQGFYPGRVDDRGSGGSNFGGHRISKL